MEKIKDKQINDFKDGDVFISFHSYDFCSKTCVFSNLKRDINYCINRICIYHLFSFETFSKDDVDKLKILLNCNRFWIKSENFKHFEIFKENFENYEIIL
mgnify:CR=1 FL=1